MNPLRLIPSISGSNMSDTNPFSQEKRLSKVRRSTVGMLAMQETIKEKQVFL